MRTLFITLLLLVAGNYLSHAQKGYADLSNEHATGETAYDVTAYVEQFWRLAGNPGFDSSIYYVVGKLKNAGFVPEGDSNARLTYRIEKRPLDHPAWHPVDAQVSLAGNNELLLNYSNNRNMISVNSRSTPTEGITAPVVRIRELEDLAAADVRGKIVYGEIHPYYLFNAAVGEFGALGIMTYGMPAYLEPETNRRSIQFNSIPYNDSGEAWSIALSYAANEQLKEYLENGGSEVHVRIETEFIDSDELTIVAQIHGKSNPDEEVVLSAHVQEPGANDNASGVGAATEIAENLAGLVRSGEYDPERTITFLWGDEIVSTRRYVEEHGEKIKWGFSLDMVGENTAVTGGSFLIEKMPDPSAIWTRGNDKHTEWGGSPIGKDQLQPHYLNDFVISKFTNQASRSEWNVNTNPFEGGSDHVPFLRANIPSVLFWHFTDQFYHTDQDRIDKVSQETLRNVVAGTMTSVMELASGGEALALNILREIEQAAKTRLDAETALSRNILQEGGSKKDQEEIIRTWTSYYEDVAGTVEDLSGSDVVKTAIKETRKSVADYGRLKIGEM